MTQGIGRRIGVSVTLLFFSGLVVGAPQTPSQAQISGLGQVESDFNADGYSDLAIAAPFDDLEGAPDAGSVTVIHGSEHGLDENSRTTLTITDAWPDIQPQVKDFFGYALTTGFFNPDTFSDLAISAPGREVEEVSDSGVVAVLYGSPSGLSRQTATSVSQGSADGLQPEAFFGQSLASGDFDGDTIEDLVVGVPADDVNSDAQDAGSIIVFYGGVTGVSGNRWQKWTQASHGIASNRERNDQFGHALAAGDLGSGPEEDLAIGVHFEDLSGMELAGGVHVLYGSPQGLSARGSTWITRRSLGLDRPRGRFPEFGYSVTVGDFGRGGGEDLAIGAPSQGAGGIVYVVYSKANGVARGEAQRLSQASEGIADRPERGDRFGVSLAAGNYDDDSQNDLVVSASFEDIGASRNAGAIHILFGSKSGLAGNALRLTQRTLNAQIEEHDNFGLSITLGGFGDTSERDLVVSSPGESEGEQYGQGIVHIMYARSSALSVETIRVKDGSESDQRFGFELASD